MSWEGKGFSHEYVQLDWVDRDSCFYTSTF